MIRVNVFTAPPLDDTEQAIAGLDAPIAA
jgi:hypothetical protein